MSWFGEVYSSAVGKKAVMAVSGIILFGFVLVHMIGNLKLYEGPQVLNNYAGFLRSVGSPAIPPSGLLWLARSILLAAVLLHMWAAWQVTRMSQKARPIAYSRRGVVQASYASRTMRWGGVIILLFVVFIFVVLIFVFVVFVECVVLIFIFVVFDEIIILVFIIFIVIVIVIVIEVDPLDRGAKGFVVDMLGVTNGVFEGVP